MSGDAEIPAMRDSILAALNAAQGVSYSRCVPCDLEIMLVDTRDGWRWYAAKPPRGTHPTECLKADRLGPHVPAAVPAALQRVSAPWSDSTSSSRTGAS